MKRIVIAVDVETLSIGIFALAECEEDCVVYWKQKVEVEVMEFESVAETVVVVNHRPPMIRSASFPASTVFSWNVVLAFAAQIIVLRWWNF